MVDNVEISESPTEVEITKEDINVELDSGFVVSHSLRHEEGGADEIDVEKLNIAGDFDLETFDLLADGTTTVWDNANDWIPQGRLENDSLTVKAGDGLKSGGNVALGSSVGLDVEPADFAGVFLSDDGSDNLTVDLGFALENDGSGNIQFDEDANLTLTGTVGVPADTFNATEVDIGRGLEDDGTGAIQFDEDTSYTFTTVQNYSAGLDTQGDITDGTQVIWDASIGEIPDSAMGSIDNATLTNDSVTVNANDGLKSGGTVALGGSVGLDIEPADFAGLFLSDDGSDNLTVNIGRGLENDTTGSIRFDEDTAYTFTSTQTFSAGAETNGDITDGATVIYDSSASHVEQSALENDSVTVTSGDGLKNGGLVSLGGSTTLDIEPADFAGTFLSDDGVDNLQVDIGRGLENDGTGAIRFDEDVAYTFTGAQTFNGGITMGSDVDFQSTFSAINVPDPTDPDELSNKAYVDAVAQGLNLKESVAVSDHDQQIDLTATTDPNPLDGYTLSDGERVLLKHQNDATENGIYDAVVATDPSTWVRSADMDEDSEATEGAFTFIRNGTTHADTSYIITSPDPITLGTSDIIWSQFASAGEITGGDGLTKSGNTLSVASSDLTGSFLSTDGNNNLDVNVGRGLENDGTDTIQFDEDTSFTYTTAQTFSAGLDTQGDITDGTQVIWDASVGEIPDSAMGSIANATLTNSDLTVTAGDGLKGGGLVSLGGSTTLDIEPAEFAGTFLSDDGTDDLTVDIGRGLENDGTGAIQFDEDTSYTFTSETAFSADITSGDSNGAIEVDERASIADSGTAQLSRDALAQGYAMIQDVTNGASVMVYLAGVGNTVEIIHDSGDGTNFSTTEGNNGTTNVYYDSTNDRYEINNETGDSATYSVEVLKG